MARRNHPTHPWHRVSVWRLGVLIAVVLSGRPTPVPAQSANGSTSLIQELFTAGGGELGLGAPKGLSASLGEPMGGDIIGATSLIQSGFQGATASPRPGSRDIVIQGSVDEANSQVTITNSTMQTPITVTRNGTAFQATVTLREGPNVITVKAEDAATNATTKTLTLTLDTWPPARPIASAPPLATGATQTLSGTKAAGTTVWVNGNQVSTDSTVTTWSKAVSLVEGDNVFLVTAKDAAGNQSTANRVVVVLDNAPPVITVTSAMKTNLAAFPVTGTVDDRLTAVTVNGRVADRIGTTFIIDTALVEGANPVAIKATSPNGYVTTKTISLTRGTAPTLQSLTPIDGVKLPAGTAVTLRASATDKEQDPIQYQFFVDGAALAPAAIPQTQDLARPC